MNVPDPRRNIRLLIEYDGTAYAGWQRQTNGSSIQESLETVLSTVTGEPVTIHGAGRTDAGVHARGQVANFRTSSHRGCYELMGSLNGMLPGDIVVLDVREAPSDFHSRFSAIGRLYTYHIVRRPAALLRNTTWLVQYPLDLEAMREATAQLIGEHDFRSFCRTISDVEHHLCTVSTALWTVVPNGLEFRISANRFLHGMVRAIVGTLIDVGRGATGLEEFAAIMDQRDRTKAGMAAPAKGLVLEKVFYPGEIQSSSL
jgi:tRNA pseudouridine38-40 synthase